MGRLLTGGRIAQPRALVDQVVRSQQEGGRNREAERPGGLAVEGQLELRGLLDRELAGLGALEDAIDVAGCPLVEVRIARAVAAEPADVYVLLRREDRRQAVPGGQL